MRALPQGGDAPMLEGLDQKLLRCHRPHSAFGEAAMSLTAAQPAPVVGQVLALENLITRDDVAEAEIARLRSDRDVLLNALTHISEDGWNDSESLQALWTRTKKTARDALAKAHSIR